VQHLLNNAIESSGKSGPVHLVLRHEVLSVVVDVIDEGPGMSPEFIRDELFRPFATTKGGGHGIGAYQARELLRAAGGDLLVLSRRPGGTTMRLLLPAVRLTVGDAATLTA
jgi:signal transduction histidine kinase